MPPRGKSSKSASRSRSRSSSRTASPRPSGTRASKVVDDTHGMSMPAPDPAAVQRLIDEALARAHSGHQGGAQPTAYHTQPRRNVFGAIWHFFFGNGNVVFTPTMSTKLSDLVGIFLVTLFVIYFSVAGYLFYREVEKHLNH